MPNSFQIYWLSKNRAIWLNKNIFHYNLKLINWGQTLLFHSKLISALFRTNFYLMYPPDQSKTRMLTLGKRKCGWPRLAILHQKYDLQKFFFSWWLFLCKNPTMWLDGILFWSINWNSMYHVKVKTFFCSKLINFSLWTIFNQAIPQD